ncbi:MAG: PAS domain S-box protein, partial [Candidatus Aminicenantes bacterium]
MLGGLYLSSLQHYLLFHSIAELFSIVIAITIFVLVWNLKDHIKNNFLVFIGTAFLFVGFIDILHTLSYKGMGIFGNGSNLATQLWIAGRYMQSLSFLLATVFIGNKLDTKVLVAVYTFITAVILSSLFVWNIFPVCYVEGMGLTPFKIISEYVISGILIFAFFLLFKKRKVFEKNIAWLFGASIVTTILSELAFTLYADVYGIFNFLGHILKIIAFYFIYRAVVIIGIKQPFALFLKSQKEESEKKLAKTEFKFSRLLDSTSDRICSRDRNNAILSWNKAFADSIKYLTGVDPYVGMQTSDFLDPAQRERLKEVFIPLYKRVFGGETIKSEFQYIEPDGKTHYYELEAAPIYSGDEVVEVAEITRDITHIKESEMKFRTVADFTYDWEYWRAAPDAPFIYISPSVERITGYSAEEFMNNPRLINEIIHPEDKSSWDRHVIDMHEKKGTGQIQFRIKNKEGKVQWIEHFCHPVTDDAGKYMGVRASNRDIT